MKEKFDVVIIGGGPGDTPAAIRLAASGKKALLAEESGKLGGACLFAGCIPSKIIKHGANKFIMHHEKPCDSVVNSDHELSVTWQSIRSVMCNKLISCVSNCDIMF